MRRFTAVPSGIAAAGVNEALKSGLNGGADRPMRRGVPRRSRNMTNTCWITGAFCEAIANSNRLATDRKLALPIERVRDDG
jgi:hypothetical protein